GVHVAVGRSARNERAAVRRKVADCGEGRVVVDRELQSTELRSVADRELDGTFAALRECDGRTGEHECCAEAGQHLADRNLEMTELRHVSLSIVLALRSWFYEVLRFLHCLWWFSRAAAPPS